MGWMAERAEQRADPKALWPEVVSVISLGLSYAPEGDALENLRRPDGQYFRLCPQPRLS